jgi:alpha-galactosidase
MRASSHTWEIPAKMALLMFPMLPVQASVESPGLLPTPPMGFNNWSRFQCELNETLFTETAQSMLTRGLRDVGYNRLNLDDCWMRYDRAADGSLQWNTTKFPHGIPWLASYATEHGFHLGIYEDAGNETCGGYPGSYGHEKQDAETFASWGIDYLKLDGCNVRAEEGRSLREEYRLRYGEWHDVLSAMPQPLIFSESAPAYFADNASDWAVVMDWIPEYGELARHSTDVLVYVGEGSAWDSIMNNYDYNTLLVRYQKPGYYNDPDFLIPDHPGLTQTEKKSHFALWASFSAPLIISAYIPDLSDEDIAFLSNKALIAVNQDPLAQQAALVSRDGTFDVLSRSLVNGDRLLTVLNRGAVTAKTTISLARLGLSQSNCQYQARDLVTGKVSTAHGAIEIQLDSHATSVHRIALPKRCSTTTPTGMVFHTPSGLCMTASSGNTVTFEACKASDSQVWSVAAKGGSKLELSPLSDNSVCLTAQKGAVSLAKCGGSGNTWQHFITGHLSNTRGGCLTGESGKGAVQACVVDNAAQIFGLPSGVKLADGAPRWFS